ncbi:hypothetical protein [Hymenobacter sp. PAMC 26628]|uniref:hypothetical protein n=1 Tax=Hymenobacter sp. PAMC 26628 TaxID=1484118 RepID=UPI0007704698|nr:hypothetical protein [Hymenobacter sp. PAMC 26628]AMJ65493.1 hypothetical protein AXW84_08670 [Hymenobacter sp. PAMC 26628]
MSLALALVLNAALLAALLPWLRREWRACGAVWRAALVAGLLARLLVGGLRDARPVSDGAYVQHLGELLTAQLWSEPASGLRSLAGDVVQFAGERVVYYGMSNTLFLAKVLALLNLASLASPWLNAVYLSLFSFVGCWQLARTLAKRLPATPAGAGLVGLVLWPSVAYWAAGLNKEAILLGSSAWLLALMINKLYAQVGVAPRPWWGPAVAGLALLCFKMRYFFAVPLMGGLLGLALVRALQRRGRAQRRGAQMLVLVALLVAGAAVAPEVSVAFRLNKFTSQVVRIYDHDLLVSAGRPHFAYADLRPTAASFLAHTPQAAWNTFTRPWLGESAEPQYVAAGLENGLLLALGALALAALVRGRPGRLPFALAVVLLGYCLLLAALMGLSTPNLGTLGRYRSAMLPFWLLLLLQNDYAAAALRRLGLGAPAGPAPAQSPDPVA